MLIELNCREDIKKGHVHLDQSLEVVVRISREGKWKSK